MSVKHVHKRPNPRHFRLKTKGGYINDVVLTYAKAARIFLVGRTGRVKPSSHTQ